ncbi:hypothetical protein AGMMS50276_23370 [Synergistales bacterium]|nr:hypothetical protein AGMMS50276_23370 [Synergistales bacterium]
MTAPALEAELEDIGGVRELALGVAVALKHSLYKSTKRLLRYSQLT